MSNNRECVICGRSYRACKNCEDAAKVGQYRWRNSCDKPECFQVLLILTDFYYARIDKYKAREMLSGVLSDNMQPYDPNAKVLIDRIYTEDIATEETIESDVPSSSTGFTDELSVEAELEAVETSAEEPEQTVDQNLEVDNTEDEPESVTLSSLEESSPEQESEMKVPSRYEV